jgi:hypothetical protein
VLATKMQWIERMVGAVIIAHRCRRKIQRLSRKLPIDRQPRMKDGVRRRFPGYSYDLWHRAYAAVNGRASVDYVPEDLFYNVFETRLNPRNRREPYKDKNFFDRMGWECLPQTIFRIINGRLFDKTYEMIDIDTALALAHDAAVPELVVKPAIDSGSGSRVAFLDEPQLAAFLPANLKPHSDWIVQRPIVQHEDMARLNPSSVNTLRVVTIRTGADVSVISSFAKIGTPGSRVDNVSAGNIAVGIEEDGRLRQHGYDFAFRQSAAHPSHGYTYRDVVIPSFESVLHTCVRLHRRVPDLDLLSWDVAIGRDGNPVVIEVNIRRQDVNITQICNGPVFSPYVDAVLARHEWLVIPGIGAIDAQADMAPESFKVTSKGGAAKPRDWKLHEAASQ